MGIRQRDNTNTNGLDDVSNKKRLEADFIDLADQPIAKVVVDYIIAGNLDPEKLKTEAEKKLRWNFSFDSKVSFCLGLYVDSFGDVVNYIDIAVARIQSKQQIGPLAQKINSINSYISVPVRYVIDEEKMLVKISFIAENEYTSPEAFKAILPVCETLSLGLLEGLQNDFGLRPFYDQEKSAA